MLDFPGPGGLTVGQIFTSAGMAWQWDGAKWGSAGVAGGTSGDQNVLIAALIDAVQQLSAKVTALEAILAAPNGA